MKFYGECHHFPNGKHLTPASFSDMKSELRLILVERVETIPCSKFRSAVAM